MNNKSDIFEIRNYIDYSSDDNQILYTYNDKETNIDYHYLMWSGGCDSTLLLYELLETYGLEKVITISYKYPWLHDLKYKTEQIYRELFKTKLKKKFGEINHTEIEIINNNKSGFFIDIKSNGLVQPINWLLSISGYIKDNSYIYNGMIRGDDLIYLLHEYKNIIDNISKIMNKNINLRQPYMYLKKFQIIEKLFKYDIYNYTWFCENPKKIKKSCLKCIPCKNHISNLIKLYITTEDNNIKEKSKIALNKLRVKL